MSKHLQIDYVNVKKVQFGEVTQLEDGVLTINKEELKAKINSSIFSSLEIHLVAPGEDCRVLAIHDIMQPRCKADHPEESYPGLWGKLAPAGEGRTVALRGVMVGEIMNAPCNIKYYMDMGGPCAKYTCFSRHFHVIIDAFPAPGGSVKNFV
ncbi:MAG: glycine/sarcosine/betaine reductase component B subunit [Pyramidobacter sp.]|nr:glycine/sarcosine/betaine reductase component B subunit [Pyramidobacter sp.]